MKVIDLLNKIANGEKVPRKFRYEGKTFIYNDYLKEHFDEKEGRNSFNFTFDLTDYDVLNDEVQIIEDTPKENKKIEHITDEVWEFIKSDLIKKIKEIIDKENGK